MALAHGYALPFVTQKVVGDYASDNAAATARAIASGATKEAAGSCLDARAINLQMRVPQRTDTNLLTNSAMAGATGSVLPTKWVSGSVNGLTVTISSAFTSAGFQAIDWTVSGTADSDGTIYIGCEPNDNTNAIPASIGQQYIGAMSLGKQAGTIPATMVMQVLGQKSSDGSVIETANSSTDLNGLVSGSLTRVNTAVLSIASVSSNRVNFRLTADVAALDVISFTIRIAAPQVERNDRISPYITTTTGAASRVTGQPSILIVPQLTRAGFVYPQLPTVSGADFTFTRATTATRVNASGLIESVASGVPRIDWLGQSCPALLVEASGQNLFQRSEDFNNAYWSKANCIVSGDLAIAPDGNLTADKLIMNNGILPNAANQSGFTRSETITSGTYRFSVFAKAAEFTGFRVRENVVQGTFLDVNLTNGAITNGDVTQFINPLAENYGNGWYRISWTSPTITSLTKYSIRVGSTGDGTSGIFVWGAQVEAGSVTTTYIPTTTAAVSRAADVISASGALVSGLIGQTEGTMYLEIDLPNPNAQNGRTIIELGASPTRIYVAKEGPNNIFQLATQSSAGYNFVNTANQTAPILKFAIAYASGNNAFYVNGTQISTASANANPTGITSILLGAANGNTPSRIRAAALYTTRLSNDQLANITRLT